MQKKPNLILIVLYPYLYMIGIAVGLSAYDRLEGAEELQSMIMPVLLGVGLLVTGYVFIKAIVTVKCSAKGAYSAGELAKQSMMIKLAHIPAYLLHFALGVIGFLMSVWGVGLILWTVLIDGLTITLSGMIALSGTVCCKKEGILSGKESLIYGILGFVYCVDVISGVILFKKVRTSRADFDSQEKRLT